MGEISSSSLTKLRGGVDLPFFKKKKYGKFGIWHLAFSMKKKRIDIINTLRWMQIRLNCDTGGKEDER